MNTLPPEVLAEGREARLPAVRLWFGGLTV